LCFCHCRHVLLFRNIYMWPASTLKTWPQARGSGLDLGLGLRVLASALALAFWPCLTSLVVFTSEGGTAVASLATPSSTTSSSQHLDASLPELSICPSCGGSDGCCCCRKPHCTRWSLNGFARNVYASLLMKTAFRVLQNC